MIKFRGKAGVLGDAVTVYRQKSKIVVTAQSALSKSIVNSVFLYLKYLAKKYLKEHKIGKRLVSVCCFERDRNAYELKYFNIADHEAEDEV